MPSDLPVAPTLAKDEETAPAGHAAAQEANRARLAWTLGLVASFMLAEIVGGLLTNSLALLADAAHMFSDAAALGLALFAASVARRPPTPQRSYGYYRAEILAALANGATLIAVSVYVLVEAVERFFDPPHVHGGMMLGVAFGGLIVNILGLWILHGGRSSSLNVHAAWLHVLSDTLGSVAVILAAGLIWAVGWAWADPLASVLIAALVIRSSWFLLKESVAVLMEGAPGHLDIDAVRQAMAEVAGVRAIEDLHVWTITSGLEALSAHVVVEGRSQQDALEELRSILHDRFGIGHITIQIEPAGFHKQTSPF